MLLGSNLKFTLYLVAGCLSCIQKCIFGSAVGGLSTRENAALPHLHKVESFWIPSLLVFQLFSIFALRIVHMHDMVRFQYCERSRVNLPITRVVFPGKHSVRSGLTTLSRVQVSLLCQRARVGDRSDPLLPLPLLPTLYPSLLLLIHALFEY